MSEAADDLCDDILDEEFEEVKEKVLLDRSLLLPFKNGCGERSAYKTAKRDGDTEIFRFIREETIKYCIDEFKQSSGLILHIQRLGETFTQPFTDETTPYSYAFKAGQNGKDFIEFMELEPTDADVARLRAELGTDMARAQESYVAAASAILSRLTVS